MRVRGAIMPEVPFPRLETVPKLALTLSALAHPGNERDVGYTIINYNTATQTLRCVASLVECLEPPAWILILDNGSAESDFGQLESGLSEARFSHIQLFRSDANLGFAAGSNFLVDQLLCLQACNYIGLLNNDALAMPEMIGVLRRPLDVTDSAVGMSGARMHKLDSPEEVDTLGIAMYASLMPADRKDISDPYLGPTGGCCMMTRCFVEDMKATTGYLFDERFFCYCEDTDLALRANLLGYRPAYVDQLAALHEGQASSRTRADRFIAYHGLRNSLWMHWKLIPTSILARHSPWLLLAHLLTIARHTLSGQPGVLFAIYRDAFGQLPALLAERAKFRKTARVAPSTLRQSISSRFYRRGYASFVFSEWLEKML